MLEPTSRAETIVALKTRFGAAQRSAEAQSSGERRVQKNLRLPERAAKHLAALAKTEGLSQAALVVKALQAYDARNGSPD